MQILKIPHELYQRMSDRNLLFLMSFRMFSIISSVFQRSRKLQKPFYQYCYFCLYKDEVFEFPYLQ